MMGQRQCTANIAPHVYASVRHPSCKDHAAKHPPETTPQAGVRCDPECARPSSPLQRQGTEGPAASGPETGKNASYAYDIVHSEHAKWQEEGLVQKRRRRPSPPRHRMQRPKPVALFMQHYQPSASPIWVGVCNMNVRVSSARGQQLWPKWIHGIGTTCIEKPAIQSGANVCGQAVCAPRDPPPCPCSDRNRSRAPPQAGALVQDSCACSAANQEHWRPWQEPARGRHIAHLTPEAH